MKPDTALLFSVIIPTYNRPQTLRQCLRALGNQQLDKTAYEIIVVNDGGEPLQHLQKNLPDAVTLLLLNQANAGPAAARNAGAAVARGKYLVFTDDDCAPDERWLHHFEHAFFNAPQRTLLGGKTINALPQNIYASASQLLVDFLYEFHAKTQSPHTFYTSNNMAISKQNFDSIGGFDQLFPTAAAEDREFSIRWAANNGNLRFVPKAINFHYHQMTFRKYFRQHFNYGRGARILYQMLNVKRYKISQQFLPKSFYMQLFTFPWKSKHAPRLKILALCGLLFVSQFANALGYFYRAGAKSTLPTK